MENACTHDDGRNQPDPVKAALSGVKRALKPDQRLWYRRTFAAAGLSEGKRLLLHFGAVDWEAVVSVNGKEVGTHRGGYDPFTCDITEAVKPGADNELLLRVWDSTGAGGEPKGNDEKKVATQGKPAPQIHNVKNSVCRGYGIHRKILLYHKITTISSLN